MRRIPGVSRISSITHSRQWGCFWSALGAWLLITVLIAIFAPLVRQAGAGRLGPGSPAATPASTNPNDFYSRVYLRAPVGEAYPLPAADPAAASQLAGFPVLMPAGLPPGFTAPARVGMNSAHGYHMLVDLAAARLMLNLAGLPLAGLPDSLERVETLVTVQSIAGMHASSGGSWFTLLEGRPPLPGLPEGIDPAVFERLGHLGLRYIGLSEEQAAALAPRLTWTWFLAFPPGDLLRGEVVPLRGTSGLLLRSSQPGSAEAALIWENGGVIYALYGNLDPETLVWMVESLR